MKILWIYYDFSSISVYFKTKKISQHKIFVVPRLRSEIREFQMSSKYFWCSTTKMKCRKMSFLNQTAKLKWKKKKNINKASYLKIKCSKNVIFSWNWINYVCFFINFLDKWLIGRVMKKCEALCDLLPFVQFKKRETHPGKSLKRLEHATLLKVKLLNRNF